MHHIKKNLFHMDLIFGRKKKELQFLKKYFLRFASHWKHQNRSYRTLTKAFGLRLIISVSRLIDEY
jgi:hypothetical protein